MERNTAQLPSMVEKQLEEYMNDLGILVDWDVDQNSYHEATMAVGLGLQNWMLIRLHGEEKSSLSCSMVGKNSRNPLKWNSGFGEVGNCAKYSTMSHMGLDLGTSNQRNVVKLWRKVSSRTLLWDLGFGGIWEFNKFQADSRPGVGLGKTFCKSRLWDLQQKQYVRSAMVLRLGLWNFRKTICEDMIWCWDLGFGISSKAKFNVFSFMVSEFGSGEKYTSWSQSWVLVGTDNLEKGMTNRGV